MNAQKGSMNREEEYENLMAGYAYELIKYADKWRLPREQIFTTAAAFFVWAVEKHDMNTLEEADGPGDGRGNIVELHPREQDWRTERGEDVPRHCQGYGGAVGRGSKEIKNAPPWSGRGEGDQT